LPVEVLAVCSANPNFFLLTIRRKKPVKLIKLIFTHPVTQWPLLDSAPASRNKSPVPDNLEARRWTGFAAVLILLSAGVATSWNGYQATRWMSVQDGRYSRANALHTEAARASTEAGAMKSIDALAFQSWLIAYAERKTELQDFYRQRFRREFSIAFDKWYKEQPLLTADATPLERPEYRLESAERALRLEAEASRIFAEGETASYLAEKYMLNSVSLSLALLFAGLAKSFRSLRLKVLVLSGAALSFGIALVRIATLPVQ
jgi:hypothetical protein